MFRGCRGKMSAGRVAGSEPNKVRKGRIVSKIVSQQGGGEKNAYSFDVLPQTLHFKRRIRIHPGTDISGRHQCIIVPTRHHQLPIRGVSTAMTMMTMTVTMRMGVYPRTAAADLSRPILAKEIIQERFSGSSTGRRARASCGTHRGVRTPSYSGRAGRDLFGF
jgi:hypothetical protein